MKKPIVTHVDYNPKKTIKLRVSTLRGPYISNVCIPTCQAHSQNSTNRTLMYFLETGYGPLGTLKLPQ
jgi:hypothetical protein